MRRCASYLSGTKSPRRLAFTMIEVLVVLGIIVILMAIMLPSLYNARLQAKSLTCLSNQRQIAMGMQAYAQDFDERMPISQYFDLRRFAFVTWDSTTFAADPDKAEPGLVIAYLSADGIQQCPAYEGESSTPGDTWTGYNYNTTYIGRGQNEGAFRGMGEAPAQVSSIRFSTSASLIGDGGWAQGANKYMRSPGDLGVAPGVVLSGGQAFRHQDATNVTFLDGHASTTKAKFKRLDTLPADEALLGWPKNGFLSSDEKAYAHR